VDLAMVAPLPRWWAYLDLEDSEKDLFSRWPTGFVRKPLMAQTLRLAVLLSTTAKPLVPAQGASSAAGAGAGAAVEQQASKDWREGRKEEWLAAAEEEVSQQAIHSLQD
jgi:hypothetical protein